MENIRFELPEGLEIDLEELNKSDRPLVSVVMPSLNVGKYMRQCLESVMDQSLTAIEIICVDAGSTDGTFEIIEELAKKDARVKVIKSDKKSYGYQMNIGIQAATADYIGIVETDDYIHRDMYASLYSTAEKFGAEVVKSENYRVTGEDAEVGTSLSGVGLNKMLTETEVRRLFNAMPAIWAGLYRRDFLIKNNITFNETPGASYQDAGFILKVLLCVKKLYALARPFYYYRTDNENSSVRDIRKVYCVNDEFESVDVFLYDRPELEKRFAFELFGRKASAYLWNYERLSDELRLDFLYRAGNEYRNDVTKRGIDISRLPEWKKNMVKDIMDTPELYYYRHRGTGAAAYDLIPHEKQDAPFISVVIYNYEKEDKYTQRCFYSLNRQTCDEFEVICPTCEEAARISKKDKRFIVAADGDIFKYVRGKYLLFVEARDSLARNAVEYLVKAVENDFDLIAFGLLKVDDRHGSCERATNLGAVKEADIKTVLNVFPFTSNVALYKKEAAQKAFKCGLKPETGAKNLAFADHIIMNSERIGVCKYYIMMQTVNGRLEEANDLASGIISARDITAKAGEKFSEQLIMNAVRGIESRRSAGEKQETVKLLTDAGIGGLACGNESLRARRDALFTAKKKIDRIKEREKESDYTVEYKNRSGLEPVVSIIIPTYNTEDYLAEATGSALNQTLKEIEVILVNDGSTDRSHEIMRGYAEKDARVVIIDQKNAGLSASRNHAIETAQGKYLYFLDSDDKISKETAEELVSRAESENLDAVFFDSDVFYSDGEDDAVKRLMSDDNYIRTHDYSHVRTGGEYIRDTFKYREYRCSACMQLVRRELIFKNGLMFENGLLMEDNLYTFTLLTHAGRVCHVNKPYYHRRLRGGSITTQSTRFEHAYGYYRAYSGMIKVIKKTDIDDASVLAALCRVAESCLVNARGSYMNAPDDEKAAAYALGEDEYLEFTKYVIEPAELKAKLEAQTRKTNDIGGKLKKCESDIKRLNNAKTDSEKKIKEREKRIDEYAKKTDRLKQTIENITNERDGVIRKLDNANGELDSIKNSVSYRIGRLLTAVPRRLKRVIKK